MIFRVSPGVHGPGLTVRYEDNLYHHFFAGFPDINSVFDLFSEDFTYYIHLCYRGTYSREELYEGYLRNQQNGYCDGKVTDIRILNRIFGLNAVAVQKRFVEKRDGGAVEKEPEMTLFEIRDGKIHRITEYW